MDYKQKYLKYKQKYLRLLRDQKGGKPFLSDILTSLVFSWLFVKNQRHLELFFFPRRHSTLRMPSLGNITLNHKLRLSAIARGSFSIELAKRFVKSSYYSRSELQLAKRILSRVNKVQVISPLTCVATLQEHISYVTSVAFHASEPIMATGGQDSTAKLWRLVYTANNLAPTCVATLDQSNGGHRTTVSSIVFHTNLPLLATGSHDNTTKVWHLVTTADGMIAATCVATLDQSNGGHNRSVRSVAFHPTDPILATGSNDDTIKIWQLESVDGMVANGITATCIATLDQSNGGHSDWVRSVAFHPSLPLMATGSDDMSAKVWHLVTTADGMIAATCMATLNKNNGGHSNLVCSVAFHPTEPLLATGSDDNTAKVWRLKPSDGTAPICVATLDQSNEGHNNTVSSVAFHPSLPLLATSSIDDTTKVWHLVTTADGMIAATCMTTLDDSIRGHSRGVTSVAFHPKEHFLATGSQDETIKLWK